MSQSITPLHSKSLSQAQLEDHRALIASEVKIHLSVYYQPGDDPKTEAGALAFWCDQLEDWTHEQVVYALRRWNEENSRLRPTPGDIVGLLKAARGVMEAKRQREAKEKMRNEEEARERVTPERAAEIAAEVGVKWSGPKVFPKIGEGAE